jgi:hypothetical protein
VKILEWKNKGLAAGMTAIGRKSVHPVWAAIMHQRDDSAQT